MNFPTTLLLRRFFIHFIDPESSTVMKLVLNENTSNIRVLADYLLTDEDLRRRGGKSIRHQKRKDNNVKLNKKREDLLTDLTHYNIDYENATKALKKSCQTSRLAPVFVDTLFYEGRACEAIAKRILISRDPHTGEKKLKIGEEYEFMTALRDAFAESEFDFFVNVDHEYLTFKVRSKIKRI